MLIRDFNVSTKGFNSSIMRFNNDVMTLKYGTIKRKTKI